MPHLILARHGETAWNVERRYQGIKDISLNARGIAQAAALVERLADEHVDAIYASDMQRAHRTAQAIAAPRGLLVRTDPRLREIAFGEWEGLTYDEIQAQYPTDLARWLADPEGCPPPGGESLAQLGARVGSLMQDITAEHSHQTVLVVAHGGSLKALLCLALGLELTGHWHFRLDPASVSEVHLYPEGAIISLLNDCHHVEGIA